MGPGIQDKRLWSCKALQSGDVRCDITDGIIRRISLKVIGQIAGRSFFEKNRCPSARYCSGIDPCLQGHSISESQTARVIHCYPIADPIEVEGIAEFSLACPGCAVNGSSIVETRRVSCCGATPLI